MKQEYTSVDGGFSKRPIYRRHCEHCDKETLFQAYKCLTCEKFATKISHSKPKVWNNASSPKRRINRWQINRDRYAALKAQAEESRKKFEGGK